MKNRLRACCLTAVSLLFFASKIAAQPTNFSVQISTDPNQQMNCTNSCKTLYAEVIGGVAPYVYSWSGPNGFLNTTQVLTICIPGQYKVIVTDANGNFAEATIAITSTVNPPTIYVSAQAACDGCNGSITVSTPGGMGSANVCQFLWSNGVISQSSVLTGLCPGQYTVTVTDCVTGCTNTATAFVNSGFTASLTSDNPNPCNSPDSSATGANLCEKVCPGQTVNYYLHPDNATVTWQVTGAAAWHFNPDGQSINVTWATAGSGQISFSFPSAQCQTSYVKCIEITEAPQAIIGTSPQAVGGVVTVCQNQPIYFQNQSLHSEFVQWSFGDFSAKNETQNPTHAYAVAGDYQVVLIAKSPCLCVDTAFLTVHVTNGTAPTLDCVGTICKGTEVTYSAGENCSNYAWNVSPEGQILSGGGPSDNSITIAWTSGELGQISLAATSCSPSVCPIPAVFQVPIISNDAEIIGDERICYQEEATYEIAPFGGANFVWTLASGGQIKSGQGTNKIKVQWTAVPNATVSHSLSVTYDNCYLGCGGSDNILVKILPKYLATGPLEICEGAAGSFAGKIVGTLAPLNLNWQVVAQNQATVFSVNNQAAPSINFNNGAGQFFIKTQPADPSKTCSDEYDFVVQVKALPDAPTGISGENQVCPAQPYTYEITGATAGNNTFWTITNGSPAAQQGEKAVVTWAASGVYSISAKQVSADALGCPSASVTFSAQKLPNPTISGDAVLCAQTEGNYTTTTFQNIDYQWVISPSDAGTVADGQGTAAAKIFWYTAGDHSVSVAACGQTASFNVHVNPLPEPVAVAPPILCENTTATVTTSTAFSTYLWKNEQGATVSTAANPSLAAGHFEVEVTDANGCLGDSTFFIDVRPVPNVNISSPDIEVDCPNLPPVRIYSTDTDEGLDFQWFMDGNPFGLNTNSIVAPGAGTFQVVATDNDGCTSASNFLTVFACGSGGGGGGAPGGGAGCPFNLSLDFNIVPQAECNIRNYQSIADPAATPGSEHWVFGNYGTAASPNPYKIYPQAGYVKVIFYMDYNGNQCGIYKPDSVVLAADFKEIKGCAGENVVFEDISTFLPPTSIASWNWNFGDAASGAANTSSTKNPSHIFSASGNFNVVLTVTSSSGCTSMISKTVQIAAPPVATILDPTTNCAGNALEFLSQSPTTDLADWKWSFGDAASGSANEATVNPAFHKFNAAGNFIIGLEVKNIGGCKASFTKNFTVAPNPLGGSIARQPSNGKFCEGMTATLTSPSGGVAWTWAKSDGTIVGTANSLIVNASGNFSLTITDSNGCTFSPADAVVEMIPAPDGTVVAEEKNDFGLVNGVFPSPYEICEGHDVFLHATGNKFNYTYYWPDGLENAVEEFSDDRGNRLSAGTYSFVVTVTDFMTGCSNTIDPFSVVVNPVPTNVLIQSAPVGPLCGHQNVTLSVQNPQATLVYEWNTGQPGAFFQTDDAGNYLVVATNAFGCSAPSNSIQIQSGAPIESVPTGCHTRCSPDTICFNIPPTATAWQWFLNGNPLAAPDGTTANLIATQSGEYTVLITDANGCTATTEPLTLDIQPGFGSIAGQMWADLNQNGLVDSGDTLKNGIPVLLILNGTTVATTISNPTGGFSFSNIAAGNYVVQLDTANLPSGWQSSIFQQNVVISGCEGLTTAINLAVKICQPISQSVQLKTCAGQSVLYQNQSLAAGSTTIFTLKTAFGCDSVVTVTVVDFPTASSTVNLSACAGDFAQFNGQQIAAGTSQNFVFQTQNGCDSTVSVVVATLPTINSTVNLSACAGDFAQFNGQQIAAGTSQNFVFQTQNGCDSTVTVAVATLPTATSTVNLSACAGDFAAFNGQQIAAGTTKIFPFQTQNGCDSTITVVVAAWPVPSPTLIQLSACSGNSVIYQNQSFLAGSTTTLALQTTHGCDSTVVVSVTAAQPSSASLSLSVCPTQTIDFQGVTLAAGDSKVFVLPNAAGCDSTLTVSVSGLPSLDFQLKTDSSCTNISDGKLVATAILGAGPFDFSLDGGTTWQDSATFKNLAAGSKTLKIRDANGCFSQKTTVVEALPPLGLVLETKPLPCDSSGILLKPTILGGGSAPKFLEWKTGDGSSLGSSLALPVGGPGRYIFSVKNRCESVEKGVDVAWDDSKIGSLFFAPNAFVPESSGNSTWRVFWSNEIQVVDYQADIFDRWGNRVFSAKDPAASWDGRFKSKKMEPAVFVWQVRATINVCGQTRHLVEKGDLTLIR